ncbi:MAG: hypothetical protein CSB33_03440 [Desulfobacterales bacterium]|nr:MAG: hypothetical protein CSB33_03440 [Desulfobacterales bacterium]
MKKNSGARKKRWQNLRPSWCCKKKVQAIWEDPGDRQQGSRLAPACDATGISVRTYQRWTKGDIMKPDGRPEAERPKPAKA